MWSEIMNIRRTVFNFIEIHPKRRVYLHIYAVVETDKSFLLHKFVLCMRCRSENNNNYALVKQKTCRRSRSIANINFSLTEWCAPSSCVGCCGSAKPMLCALWQLIETAKMTVKPMEIANGQWVRVENLKERYIWSALARMSNAWFANYFLLTGRMAIAVV